MQSSQFQDRDFLTQLTLDASVLINFENIDKTLLGSLELCTREYIHRIHVRRVRELKHCIADLLLRNLQLLCT